MSRTSWIVFPFAFAIVLYLAMGCWALEPLLSDRYTANHIYTPVSSLLGNAQIVEWDLQLHEVRRIPINAEGTTGAVFNDRQNLVTIIHRGGNIIVAEYNALGTAVNEYDMGNNSLLLGSYIDFDAARQIYAFANGERVTILDHNLNFVKSLDQPLRRASGVEFAPDGGLYVSDQRDDVLYGFNSDFQKTFSIYANGSVPAGVDLDQTGKLLVTYFADGQLKRMKTSTLSFELVVGGLGYGGISDVLSLPDGRLLITDDRNRMKLYSQSGVFITQNVGVGPFGDSLAYLIPEPTSVHLLAAGVLLCWSPNYRRRPTSQ